MQIMQLLSNDWTNLLSAFAVPPSESSDSKGSRRKAAAHAIIPLRRIHAGNQNQAWKESDEDADHQSHSI